MNKEKYEKAKEHVILMKVDYAFKYVMRNEKVMSGFLSAILGIEKSEIKDIVYLDTNTDKSGLNEKLGILDLLVFLNGEKKVNIEIQISYQKYWNNRVLFYTCEEYVSGHRKGFDYADKDIPSVINVSLLDFIYFKDNPYLYNHFGIYNLKTKQKLTDKIEINIIELGKLVHILPEEEQEYPDLVRWARFISSTSWEEYEMYGKDDEAMEEAIKELEKINGIDMEYERYIRREIARRDANQRESDEREFQEKKASLARYEEKIAKEQKKLDKVKAELTREREKLTKERQEFIKSKEILDTDMKEFAEQQEIAKVREELKKKDKELEELKKELEELKRKKRQSD